jgi:deoxyribodipyrimidine photo-lyase
MTDALTLTFPPDRRAALDRLAEFVPRAGRDYAARRNYDLPQQGHAEVSRLSPYIRHRMLSETEVLQAVLGRFSPATAEKFVQEVYWRSYWKGWLELRPGVWDQYRQGVRAGQDRLATEAGLRADWEAACRGETGIDCFDAWARELTATGYLHNHARMWFASIWIFTLRLPWELGADLFLRQLLDGDPASNTLGWRWVAGIQTPGKTYLARADNIARYTEGRFDPRGQLAGRADPVDSPPVPARGPAPTGDTPDPERRTGWLLTEEDQLAGFPFLPGAEPPAPVCVLNCTGRRSPLETSPPVTAFAAGALEDTLDRHAARLGPAQHVAARTGWVKQVVDWARDGSVGQLVTPYAPVGPAADAMKELAPALDAAGVPLVRVLRPHDAACWPHATHGFFRFKEKIPGFLAALKGLRAA